MYEEYFVAQIYRLSCLVLNSMKLVPMPLFSGIKPLIFKMDNHVTFIDYFVQAFGKETVSKSVIIFLKLNEFSSGKVQIPRNFKFQTFMKESVFCAP